MFWHIFSTYWIFFLNQLPNQFESICDFSLGLKSDIVGSFGTFPAHIGGFFLNELANQFRSILIFSLLFLRSSWPTEDLILKSLSFSLTPFFVQKSDISASFGTFLSGIGGNLVNELTKHFTSGLLFPFVFLQSIWPTREDFLYSLSFWFTFFSVQKGTHLAVLAHF